MSSKTIFLDQQQHRTTNPSSFDLTAGHSIICNRAAKMNNFPELFFIFF